MNQIYLRDKGKVCLEFFKPGVWPVYMRREKPGRESVANAEKLRYPSLPSANVQMLTIRELELDLFISDDKVKYVFLNEPINAIKVLAACTDESQLAKKLFKEHVKQILYCSIKKEKEYTASKNIRFGKWEPGRKSLVQILLLVTPYIAPEITMSDTDLSIAKKCVEKKRHPRVVNVLKESVSATTIT